MRGEGNHKIPGSFAPENMEKTGAERVKYSLACQHEDAISIKFVSYAQKCPTVLCTFAVALRKESVDRNQRITVKACFRPQSLSARRAWIEISWALWYWQPVLSLSARRAWIEIQITQTTCSNVWSLSARRAWIEIAPPGRVSGVCGSLSARRAWIEIGNVVVTAIPHVVALRKESVDRNLSLVLILSMSTSSLSARRAWIEIAQSRYTR